MDPDFDCRLSVDASLSPSEDPEKLALAVANVVGVQSGEVQANKDSVRFFARGLDYLKRLKEQLRTRHVRSAAKGALYRERRGRSTMLLLNRQAAVAGVLVVCGSPEESPLGPIRLTIESDEIDAVIEWLSAYD